MKLSKYSIIDIIKSDLFRYENNITLKSFLKRYLFTPAFNYLFWIRVYQYSYKNAMLIPIVAFSRVLLHLKKIRYGISLPPETFIGMGLYIGHFGGIVISNSTIIGDYCNLSQNITIGADKTGAPVIGDNVYIAPGAVIFGKIRVGDNVKIGANCVVYKNVPDNAIIVKSPGFTIKSYKGNRPIESKIFIGHKK